ncbi:uracil-DNA glycosylase [Sporormia fimetaria CBS 119925]|uniref:Uracil-DNA glycosylase n=1 Tax=Sporormia fimetaria CBS 119925 TaxID=1340428 RepID=A0A6A6VQS5_9PLEO|nr:uracil-DNA glycosylase [Sporormia fimetaria CBS 119925]
MSLKRKAAEAAATATKKTKPNTSITSFFGAPVSKPKPAIADFSKETWVSSLTDEQKTLLKLEIDTLHDSWLPYLKDVFLSPQFLELKRFLDKEIKGGKTVYPPFKDVYSWSRHTPLNTVKAVILGQDPYHGPNQAHGLCFSVLPPTPAPPSLRNIYIALKNDYPDFEKPPKNGGLLTPWSDRGVLMINTCLTVRRGEANSHAGKGWETLTQKVIDTVARERKQGVVFLAWGKPAEGRVKGVDAKRHCILKAQHPSPLSAHRPPGFANCGHFKKTNEWLVEKYGEGAEIDWNLNVDPEKAGH